MIYYGDVLMFVLTSFPSQHLPKRFSTFGYAFLISVGAAVGVNSCGPTIPVITYNNNHSSNNSSIE